MGGLHGDLHFFTMKEVMFSKKSKIKVIRMYDTFNRFVRPLMFHISMVTYVSRLLHR